MVGRRTRLVNVGGRRRFLLWLLAIVLVAGVLRGIFPLADPPSRAPVGVVWHDEGAWVHNARNRALFGAWSLDAWNPMFVTPVLTGLAYASFSVFGVGLWQARLVSEAMGTLSVIALAVGVARLANPAAGLIAGAMLATNYVSVMYDRAALAEGTMVALLVWSWLFSVASSDRPAFGLAAAAAALLACFTKATAIFFVVALGLDALFTLALSPRGHRRAAGWTLAGLAVAGAVALALILPFWESYRFYNWEMSVTRRPSYTLAAFKDRITWLPIVHGFFTRMWIVTVLALGAAVAALPRLRVLRPGERLLILWLGLGIAELLARDVGNERYLVYLVPPLVGLAALVLGRDRRWPTLRPARGWTLVWSIPLVLAAAYVVTGAAVRLAFPGDIRTAVRLSAAVALVLTAVILLGWPTRSRELARRRWSPAVSGLVLGIVLLADGLHFAHWAMGRSSKNYAAMRALADLPPGTLVHGKLANGLALENGIRPIFVGRGFGNYHDRLARDDVPLVLTYVTPRIGYEGAVIREVLEAYPRRRILRTFDVSETPAGGDEAALIEKWPGAAAGRPRGARDGPPGEVVATSAW